MIPNLPLILLILPLILILLPLTTFLLHGCAEGSLSTENDAISYPWASAENTAGVVTVGKANSLGVVLIHFPG